MKLTLPRMGAPALTNGVFNRTWASFFEAISTGFGYSNAAPVYAVEYTPLHVTQLAATGNTDVWANIRVPENYKPGTPAELFIDWKVADPGGGGMALRHSYTTAEEGEVFSGNASTTETANVNATEDIHQRLTLTTIAADDLAPGGQISVNIERLGDEAEDTYDDTIYLLGIGLKHQAQGLGSF